MHETTRNHTKLVSPKLVVVSLHRQKNENRLFVFQLQATSYKQLSERVLIFNFSFLILNCYEYNVQGSASQNCQQDG